MDYLKKIFILPWFKQPIIAMIIYICAFYAIPVGIRLILYRSRFIGPNALFSGIFVLNVLAGVLLIQSVKDDDKKGQNIFLKVFYILAGVGFIMSNTLFSMA